VTRGPSLGTYWAQDIRGLTLCVLGDNPLRLDSAEFRRQHRRILPLELCIKSMIRILSH